MLCAFTNKTALVSLNMANKIRELHDLSRKSYVDQFTTRKTISFELRS